MSAAGRSEARPERWLAVLLSLLVHGAIAGMLGWGYWRFRAPKPAPRLLAIEATVVMDRPLTVAPAPATTAPQAPQEDPAVQQRARAEEHAQQQRAEEQARREREERLQNEQRAQAAAEARRQEQQATERKAKAAAQRAAQDKARRESELRAQLAAEERINAARGSAAEVAWLALIRDRVTRAWIRPPSARAGVNCEVLVTQVPGGEVTGVQIGGCNGDAAVRESIEAAVYRASPLPAPSNPDLFDRNLRFNFHPDD